MTLLISSLYIILKLNALDLLMALVILKNNLKLKY